MAALGVGAWMLAGIAAQSVAPPGHMQIFACDSTSPNQVFDYTSNGTLRGRLTGLCITATTGGAGESPLWPAPCVDGDPSQVFLIEGNGHIRLENRTTCDYQPCAAGTCCECFDVLGGGVASGTELALYPCASPTAPNEAFTYDAQTGLLRGTESGLCADAGSRAPLPLLASYFQDHMVLQRGVPSPVWGFAPPAATVRVTLRGEVMGSASADANGTWRFVLPAMPASAVGANLTATRTDAGSNASLTIVNVLVGDVYVCSGQSNMQFTVHTAWNATAEIAAAAHYPSIRVMTVGQGTQSSAPLSDLGSIAQAWTPATPASIGLGDWSAFSAVAWFFGRDVVNGLGPEAAVPLGLVSDNWGGTQIQAWSSPAALAACGWEGGGSNLWNAMIHPLTVGPLALTGFLWYQGEANADANQTAYYACAIQALVRSWRAEFAAPGAWFGSVQLAAYVQDASFDWHPIAAERAAQAAVLNVSNTALATAIDLGDPPGSTPPPPYGTVHPRSKQPVGSRLAANALAQVYGRTAVPHLSPRYASSQGSAAGSLLSVTVAFVPETIADGPLQLNATAACPIALGVPADECGWAEILASDGSRLNASVSLSPGGAGVVLTAVAPAAGLIPVASSYAYNAWPVASVFSAAGFPVLPWGNEPVGGR